MKKNTKIIMTRKKKSNKQNDRDRSNGSQFGSVGIGDNDYAELKRMIKGTDKVKR